MRILAPLNNSAEVEPLLAAGADGFYAGFVSPQWRERYSELAGPNRRAFIDASFTDIDELNAAFSHLQRAGKQLAITLNRAFYSPEQYDLLLADVHNFLALGINAFIVADLELMLRLQEEKLDLRLHLSSLAPTLNANTVAFYQRFGVCRIVLPRSLTTEEIAYVTSTNPGMEFDVFIFGGKCVNIEGYCGFFHLDPNRRWPCVQKFRVLPQSKAAEEVLEAELSWRDCPRYLACGLGVLGKLSVAGVRGLKVVGRGARLENKLKAVRFVKQGLDALDRGEDLTEDEPERYAEAFGRSCSRRLCYYPYESCHD